jgi:hypothetical protein
MKLLPTVSVSVLLAASGIAYAALQAPSLTHVGPPPGMSYCSGGDQLNNPNVVAITVKVQTNYVTGPQAGQHTQADISVPANGHVWVGCTASTTPNMTANYQVISFH